MRDITLYAGVPRVDVKTTVEWHEKHILLKVAFPLSAHSDKAAFRNPALAPSNASITREHSWQKWRTEVPAQRWADISDAGHVISAC